MNRMGLPVWVRLTVELLQDAFIDDEKLAKRLGLMGWDQDSVARLVGQRRRVSHATPSRCPSCGFAINSGC